MAYAGFARKAALSNKELQIVCPKQANDLVDEGKALHHCVGGYIDSVAEGRSLIVFVRRVEEPKKPYVTVEVRDGKSHKFTVTITAHRQKKYRNLLTCGAVRCCR